MRGIHRGLAEYQEKQYQEYELIWNKAFTWGFAHIEIDNVKNQLDVNFYTTPTDKSGKLIKEKSFSFKHRSN